MNARKYTLKKVALKPVAAGVALAAAGAMVAVGTGVTVERAATAPDREALADVIAEVAAAAADNDVGVMLAIDEAQFFDDGLPEIAELLASLKRFPLEKRRRITFEYVLLAGVNDSEEALAVLSETLFTAGVLPYYLHLLDKVRGAAHFDVPEQRGIELIGQLERRLPGYLVPRLVREQAGEAAKVRIRG